MEPKNPIIIDGVDVSKCNYFNNTDKSYCEECCSEFGCAICNDRPNCYYKQLKRKEQENQRYGQTLIEIEDIVKGMNIECFYSDFDCKDCDMKNGCIHQGKLKILQKISEVHVEQK